MILSFKQEFPNNQPTYFAEKILEGLIQTNICSDKDAAKLNFIQYMNHYSCSVKMNIKPKLHTIREDSKGRWKAGNLIHFAYGVRTKNYFNFAPIIPCKSIQSFRIHWHDKDYGFSIGVYLGGARSHCRLDHSKKITSCPDWIKDLAINDGFDSVDDFFKWFDKDFRGKIIHWTDLKY